MIDVDPGLDTKLQAFFEHIEASMPPAGLTNIDVTTPARGRRTFNLLAGLAAAVVVAGSVAVFALELRSHNTPAPGPAATSALAVGARFCFPLGAQDDALAGRRGIPSVGTQGDDGDARSRIGAAADVRPAGNAVHPVRLRRPGSLQVPLDRSRDRQRPAAVLERHRRHHDHRGESEGLRRQAAHATGHSGPFDDVGDLHRREQAAASGVDRGARSASPGTGDLRHRLDHPADLHRWTGRVARRPRGVQLREHRRRDRDGGQHLLRRRQQYGCSSANGSFGGSGHGPPGPGRQWADQREGQGRSVDQLGDPHHRGSDRTPTTVFR